jgi:hypothetical protein
MATELTDLELGEWSICIDPANEDSTIEIVKSKSGLGPVLKETDMSEHNEDTNDTEIEQFASEVLEEFNGLSAEEQANAIVGMALENAEFEEAVEDAAEVIKSLTENTVSKAKYDEVVEIVKKSGALIEKMKTAGHVTAEEGGLLDEIRKANGGVDLSPEAAARIEKIEKAQAEAERKESIAKARTYGFGNAEDVADIDALIRKSNPALADKFVGIVKQAGAVAKSSKVFTTIGEDGGNVDANSPIAKANSGVDVILKANPNMTRAQAMTKYWQDNPAEYAAMRQGQAA